MYRRGPIFIICKYESEGEKPKSVKFDIEQVTNIGLDIYRSVFRRFASKFLSAEELEEFENLDELPNAKYWVQCGDAEFVQNKKGAEMLLQRLQNPESYRVRELKFDLVLGSNYGELFCGNAEMTIPYDYFDEEVEWIELQVKNVLDKVESSVYDQILELGKRDKNYEIELYYPGSAPLPRAIARVFRLPRPG
jgi:hypothetical protein